jgi:DNA-binding transcriptional MerR regulator
MGMGFGAKVVKELTGVSRMQLQHWDKTGIVKPSRRIGIGKGSRREYSFRDLVQLKVAKRLREEGISLQKIRKALEYLRRNFPDVGVPLAELRFLTDGTDIFVLSQDPKAILDALKGQFVLSFALGELIDGLRGSIKDMQTTRLETVFVGKREFTAVLTPDVEDGGYTVSCKEIPAAISQGDTIPEALDSLVDALELCLETEAELRKSRASAK